MALFALAQAVSAQTEADFKFQLTEELDGVIITGYTGKTAAVRIPAAIQGVPVRQIGYESSRTSDNMGGPFAGLSHITSVVIPSSVSSIGNSAFSNCTKLTSITLPATISAIYDYAFFNCPITEIKLPDFLNRLGNSAFASSKITSISLPSSLGRRICGYSSDGSEWIFENCKNLKTVTLYEGLDSINSEMFKGCAALTSITLPNSIRYIGSEAFVGTSLTEITLTPNIIEIWSKAFKDVKTLTTVNVPATLTRIGFRSGAGDHDHFKGCSNLTVASQMALRKLGYSGDF